MDTLNNLGNSPVGKIGKKGLVTTVLAGTLTFDTGCNKDNDIMIYTQSPEDKAKIEQMQRKVDSLEQEQNKKDAHYEEALRQLREGNGRQDQEINSLSEAMRSNIDSLQDDLYTLQQKLKEVADTEASNVIDLQNEITKAKDLLNKKIVKIQDQIAEIESGNEASNQEMKEQLNKLKDGIKALATELENPNSDLNIEQLKKKHRQIETVLKNYLKEQSAFEYDQGEAFQKAQNVGLFIPGVDDSRMLGLKDYPTGEFMNRLIHHLNTVYGKNVELPEYSGYVTKGDVSELLTLYKVPGSPYSYLSSFPYAPVTYGVVLYTVESLCPEVLDDLSNLTQEQLSQAQNYAAQHNIPFDNIEDRQKLLTRDDMIQLVNQFCEEKGLDKYPRNVKIEGDSYIDEGAFAIVLDRILHGDLNDGQDSQSTQHHINAINKMTGMNLQAGKNLNRCTALVVLAKLY